MSTIIGDGVVRVDGKVVFGPSPYVIRACRPLVEGWQGPVLVYVGAPFEVYVPAVLLGSDSDPKYPDRWLVWRDAPDWPDTEASFVPEETAVRSVELGDLRLDLGCPTVCDRWDRVRHRLGPGLDAAEAALAIAKHLGLEAKAVDAEAMHRFAIGDACWPGIAKLIEECGEVVQVCGKLMATQGERTHWDGSDLYRRLEDELADLRAVIRFVQTTNPALDMNRILDRTETKFATFMKWHLEQR